MQIYHALLDQALRKDASYNSKSLLLMNRKTGVQEGKKAVSHNSTVYQTLQLFQTAVNIITNEKRDTRVILLCVSEHKTSIGICHTPGTVCKKIVRISSNYILFCISWFGVF